MADVQGQMDDKLIEAFEDDRYKWRTTEGVAAQLDIPAATIQKQIDSMLSRGIVIRSTIPSAEGKLLFTTRRHFQHKTPLVNRVLSAFKNRRGE